MPEFNDEIEPGRQLDQDFSNEGWKFKAGIIESRRAKAGLIEFINKFDFTQSCKLTLYNILTVSFDPNVMLARNVDGVQSRITDLEIQLNLAVASTVESDQQNAALINVTQAIKVAFGDFVSPSIGGKERDRITKIESVSHQSYAGLPNSEPEKQKRGIHLPWRKEG